MAAFTAAYGPAFLLMLVKMLAVLCAASLAMLAVQLILCGFRCEPGGIFPGGKGGDEKALVTRSGSACLPDAQEALTAGLGLKRRLPTRVSAYAISSGMQGCGAMFPAMAAVLPQA